MERRQVPVSEWLRLRFRALLRAGRPRDAALVVFGGVVGMLVLLVGQCMIREEELPPVANVADESPDITVTFSPQLLGALIRQSVEAGESPVELHNIRAQTAEDRLSVHGATRVFGQEINGRIDLQPVVDGGELRWQVRRASLGPVPAPDGLERIAERAINDQVAAALGGLPATITSARVTEDGLRVTARVRVEDLGSLSGQPGGSILKTYGD